MYDIYKDHNIDIRCLDCINGWKALEDLSLDFSHVEIVSLTVDNPGDPENAKGWKLTLKTIVYSNYFVKSAATDFMDENGSIDGLKYEELENINRRTVRFKYEVNWEFSDLWGNPARYTLSGTRFIGPLSLEYVDYGLFYLCNFIILSNDVLPLDISEKYLFRFGSPDEVRVKSFKLIEAEVTPTGDGESEEISE